MAADGQSRVVCPYNMSHVIIESRFQTHLTRCKQQHISAGFVECPFSATHLMKPDQLQSHMEECEHRVQYDRVRYVTGEANAPSIDQLVSNQVTEPHDDEDWDAVSYGSYLDSKHEKLQETDVVLAPACNQGKAAKREFYAQELERRERLAEKNQPKVDSIPALSLVNSAGRGRGRGVRP